MKKNKEDDWDVIFKERVRCLHEEIREKAKKKGFSPSEIVSVKANYCCRLVKNCEVRETDTDE